MGLIDIIVIIIIVLFGLFILYRPLKEPIDAFFGMIKNLFLWGKDTISGTSDSVQMIKYG